MRMPGRAGLTRRTKEPQHARIKRNSAGFALLEAVLALVIVAMLSAFCLPFFEKSLSGCAYPLQAIQDGASLQQSMENIVADYNENYTTNIAALQTNINNKLYGAYQVVFNNCIQFSSGAEVDCSDCASCPQKILKVTIKDSSTGETLTSLFTQ